MHDLKLGVLLWNQATDWPSYIDAVRRIDRLGYAHLWAWDHLYAIFGDPYQPIFEGWESLSASAMATEQLQVGLLVGANTFRNPGLVAKLASTLDHISGGRAILGLGGAWMEQEHTAHGIDFGSGFGQRLDWLDESVAACRDLLDGKSVTSAPGGHYQFDDLRHAPLPVQAHLPIMIGGGGEKKTLRTVAKYADLWNGMGELDVVTRKVGHPASSTARTSAATPRTSSSRSASRSRSATRRPRPSGSWRPRSSTTGRRSAGSRATRRSGTGPRSSSRSGSRRTSSSASDRDHRAAGALRHRDPRAVHRAGEAARRPRLTARRRPR